MNIQIIEWIEKEELDEMKRDIDEIKSLLKQLVNHKA